MGYLFSFEKLEVWSLAKELAKEIYKVTKGFPAAERFGIVSQVNRAAISVASNVAEGSARTNKKDKAHFYQIAYSSLMELLSNLIVSKELGFLQKGEYDLLRSKIQELSNKLNALHKHQLTNFPVQQLNSSTIKQP